MSLTQSDLLAFIRLHRYAVEVSNSASGPPQAALVGFVVNDRLELFFDCFESTRKVANLRRDPRISLVIGGTVAGDERTVQIEGVADEPTGAELAQFKATYFADLPDGRRRSRLPSIRYFRVRTNWVRYTNLNVAPAEVVVFDGPNLVNA
jgi:Pyridoxamine 5'-phosphate oxidase